jgi:hypothetical protein
MDREARSLPMPKKNKELETKMCPTCGDIRLSEEAHIYTCVDCLKEGFDCCVPGNHAICLECEDAKEE